MKAVSFPVFACYSFCRVIPKDFLKENRALILCLPLICYRVGQPLGSIASFRQRESRPIIWVECKVDRCELRNFEIAEIKGFPSQNALLLILLPSSLFMLPAHVLWKCVTHVAALPSPCHLQNHHVLLTEMSLKCHFYNSCIMILL